MFEKIIKAVIEALQELPSNYWYVIVGKGELKSEMESMDQTGRLKLLGFRSDIVELLHCSDLFVFPSLQEGLPVALMEAIAAGLPYKASKIRGNVDLLEKSDLIENNWLEGILGEQNIRHLQRMFTKQEISVRMYGMYSSIESIYC